MRLLLAPMTISPGCIRNLEGRFMSHIGGNF